jgi:hypothetical protein
MGALTIGLDVGQRVDYSAIAVVQWIERRAIVRHLERLELGTPYPIVAARVRQVVESLRLLVRGTTFAAQPHLLIDATGVGRPVLDLLREEIRLPNARITAVTLTSGSEATKEGSEWHVPKQDLVDGLVALLQTGRLELPADLPAARSLAREMETFRLKKVSAQTVQTGAKHGAHDDLVIAAGLAVLPQAAAQPPRSVQARVVSGGYRPPTRQLSDLPSYVRDGHRYTEAPM